MVKQELASAETTKAALLVRRMDGNAVRQMVKALRECGCCPCLGLARDLEAEYAKR